MKYMILFLLIITKLKCSIVINEFQPAPIGYEPEWIELYNCGNNMEIFDTLYILDATNAKQFISIQLAPKAYAVITKDTNKLKLYRQIPIDCQLIYAKLPVYNNTTDEVVLRDSKFDLIDSIYYNIIWGAKGISFERINCEFNGAYPDNLIMSMNKDSSTCGYLNSYSLAESDLSINNISVNQDNFSFNISNQGYKTVQNIDIQIFVIKDSRNEIFDSRHIDLISPNSFSQININNNEIFNKFNQRGEYTILVNILNPDDRPENNITQFNINISYEVGIILFNEILYDNDENMSEFIEIYNNTNEITNLKNWKLIDYSSSKPDTFLISDNNFIEQTDYCVLISDSNFFKSFPELLNSDKIIF